MRNLQAVKTENKYMNKCDCSRENIPNAYPLDGRNR